MASAMVTPTAAAAPPTPEEKKARNERACLTAEEFVKLYYDRMDKKRHTIGKLYLDTAKMSWNGNALEGPESVQKFLLDQVPPSDHLLTCLDAQPVPDTAVAGQTTVFVQAAGSVAFDSGSSDSGSVRPRPFQQNFLLTADGDKWRVVTDTFRSKE